MPEIGSSCPDCSELCKIPKDDVYVRVCLDDDTAEFRFTCPFCGMVIVKPAGHRTVELLVASGVSVTTWSLPPEIFESMDLAGDTINEDDEERFRENIHNDRKLRATMASLTRQYP